MSSSKSPKARSCAAVAGLPLIHARLLPCMSMVRLSKTPSCAAISSKPSSCNQDKTSGVTSNSALISARVAPSRITPDSAREPSTSCTASIKIDLPAPVSPVSAVKPEDKSKSSARTITKSRKTIWRRLMPHPHSNAVFHARCRNNSNLWGVKTELKISSASP